MNPNNSPWIKQLKRSRPIDTLSANKTTDIAIVGGGIAGLTTAYFTLKNTTKKVLLIEAGKVAHGATGHNAGQVVSYFERQVSDIVKEFGFEKTAQGQAHVLSAWDLLDEICQEAKLKAPLSKFVGYAGCGDLAEIIVHLKNNVFCQKAHLPIETLKIAQESSIVKQIPVEYAAYYELVPHEEILDLLQTENTHYIAALSTRKGVMNSALFTEEVAGYLLATYPDRFTLAEESPMTELVLEKNHALLKIKEFEVRAERVVLCTNGFEHFTITNHHGAEIDPKFHHLVRGSVGYMAAYLEEDKYNKHPPIAISYLPDASTEVSDTLNAPPYFYLTRRAFENDHSHEDDLICIAGPEQLMDDTTKYSPKEHLYPAEAQAQLDTFLHETYKYAPKDTINYKYQWHGLMGYTPNGIRCIGAEPINPVLLYNLGCNGIGILPSIYGGKRISQILAGEELPPSIFDPKVKYE